MDISILNLIIIITGLIFGSFINVLSYRLPENIPVIFSRSFCPECNTAIPLYRNIPIITYILQKGKCHNCKKTINIQYPLIELLTTLIFYFGLKNIFSPKFTGDFLDIGGNYGQSTVSFRKLGFKKNHNGFWINQNGKPIEIIISIVSGWSDWIRAGQIISSKLKVNQ